MAHRKVHSPVSSHSYQPQQQQQRQHVRRSIDNLLGGREDRPFNSPARLGGVRNGGATSMEALNHEPTNKVGSQGSSLVAARSAYLRQVSEGRAGYSHRTDPGPPKSLMADFGRSVSVQHQRSRSDSDQHVGPFTSTLPAKIPVGTPPAVGPRPKRPEELECDQLSADLIGHLPPTDSKLHALLSVPDPGHATATLRTEGLLQVRLSVTDRPDVKTEDKVVDAPVSTTAASPPRIVSPVPASIPIQSSPTSVTSSPK